MVNTMAYVLADKYEIPALKALAVKKAQFCMESNWNMPRFASALKYLYENTVSCDRDLRDVFINRAHEDNECTRACRKNVDFVKEGCLLYNPEYVAVVAEIGEIGIELLRKGTGPVRFASTGEQVYLECQKPNCERKVRCPACKTAKFFYKIEEVFDDEKVDLICGDSLSGSVVER